MPRITLVSASLVAASLVCAACDRPASSPAPGTSAAAPSAASTSASGPTRIGIELAEDKTVGALQVDIEYSGAGRFVGDADGVACETKIEGALSSYNHIVPDKLLKSAFVAVNGFSGPVRFAECSYEGAAKAEDFRVTVRDASSPDLVDLDPSPVVKVVVD